MGPLIETTVGTFQKPVTWSSPKASDKIPIPADLDRNAWTEFIYSGILMSSAVQSVNRPKERTITA